ncbi:hypothetical protein [Clavibacter michiganensis]|uniref:hypothetical protein n=1 Tax=Clavibacter michiganensis TaxID=28447 RepID=UPI001FF679C9|nr:hypothetical protein [Clavibacter michiganensis]MDO4030248.1 hypothetical protein [Clavibacter michiganensis]MDO4045677.1 hypothetical protein [Clavibacter michiganensis]MDO4054740.1 hypothetical protein [Clavibacter michiganensis]MDO4058143.1 hypothetical protein [Clavibacter michiganensis]UOW05287.1 hypothetical protein MU580_16005 [Clavibacter michiganensis subsp. michiganensis]
MSVAGCSYIDSIDEGDHPVNKVKGDVTRLVRGLETHPWAHPEAGYWRVQVGDSPVLGYVMRIRAELGDPFTYEVYADARNELGQRIWIHREASLNAAVAWMMQRSDRLVAFATRHAPPTPTDADEDPKAGV